MRFSTNLLVVLVLFLTKALQAGPVDTVNFSETTFVNNSQIYWATGMGWAPDASNRLFIICKDGNVRVIQNGSLITTPFATETTYGNSECGLIGMCFDPDFLSNHYIYLFLTVSATEQQIIRYTASTNVGTGRTLLVSGLPTIGQNHDGGGIGIGPDGKLYWSIGDNGNGTGHDADLLSLACKVSRANRFTGQPVNDNPFFDGPGPNNDYIWARGVRNPFTLTFQPVTGALWVNVVGDGWEQIFVVNRKDHAGYNDYENNQPAGYLAPIIAYRTNGTQTTDIAATNGAVRTGNIVTFTTTGQHRVRRGGKITVAGVSDASFNGTFFVASVPSNTTFTVPQTGPGASSGGGTVATANIGGCVTGGTFYESTAFPAAYHGNFFFGDYNSGKIERVILDPSQQVVSVDDFVTGSSAHVDMATGPDGALYYVGIATQTLKRLATTSTDQNLIVYPTGVQVVEGSSALFTVRLAKAPTANVTVNLTKVGGDSDVNFTGSATLTFTPANWNQLQAVTLTAATDADFTNDVATFRVSATGLNSVPTEVTQYDVVATVIDTTEGNLVISNANLTVPEGGTETFTVRLDHEPPGPVTVTVARTSGDTDLNVSGGATLVFEPDHYNVPQTVTLAAAEDADITDDSAVVSISLAGSPVRTVNISIADNDRPAPAFTSSPVVTAVVGNPYAYDSDAVGNPVPTYSLTGTPPAGMTINSATGEIAWTPTSTGVFAVNVRATNSAGTANQPFNIAVSNDQPPAASLTRPTSGEILTGSNAEFFGDGFDDVRTTKAEFFVDGILRYTDTTPGSHYHFGATHLMFDTTQFSNGPHTLRMRVTDTAGQTGQQDVSVTITNNFDTWRATYFTSSELSDPTISGPQADPDRDGYTNLIEYAWKESPKNPQTSRPPKGRIVNVDGTDYLALEFVIAKWAQDITCTVEAAGNAAGSWTAIDPIDPSTQFRVQDDTPSAGLKTFVIRDVVPKGTAQRFMRLRVVR
jgi:glucose/arabinose dehydrogenase